MITAATRAAEEREVRYLAIWFAGRYCGQRPFRRSRRPLFRSALVTWPAAQSARVALMTLLVARGERDEAAALAEATQTASENEFDPWWTYWLGDFPTYPALLDKLRELAR